MTRDKAIELVQSISKDHGFNLAQSDGTQRPSNFYVDFSSKIVKYPGLKEGPAKLAVGFDNKPFTLSKYACHTNKDVTIQADDSNTALQVDIILPSRK